jgi:hypothetical protein
VDELGLAQDVVVRVGFESVRRDRVVEQRADAARYRRRRRSGVMPDDGGNLGRQFHVLSPLPLLKVGPGVVKDRK